MTIDIYQLPYPLHPALFIILYIFIREATSSEKNDNNKQFMRCKICNVLVTASDEDKQTHMRGRKHKLNLARTKGSQVNTMMVSEPRATGRRYNRTVYQSRPMRQVPRYNNSETHYGRPKFRRPYSYQNQQQYYNWSPRNNIKMGTNCFETILWDEDNEGARFPKKSENNADDCFDDVEFDDDFD